MLTAQALVHAYATGSQVIVRPLLRVAPRPVYTDAERVTWQTVTIPPASIDVTHDLTRQPTTTARAALPSAAVPDQGFAWSPWRADGATLIQPRVHITTDDGTADVALGVATIRRLRVPRSGTASIEAVSDEELIEDCEISTETTLPTSDSWGRPQFEQLRAASRPTMNSRCSGDVLVDGYQASVVGGTVLNPGEKTLSAFRDALGMLGLILVADQRQPSTGGLTVTYPYQYRARSALILPESICLDEVTIHGEDTYANTVRATAQRQVDGAAETLGQVLVESASLTPRTLRRVRDVSVWATARTLTTAHGRSGLTSAALAMADRAATRVCDRELTYPLLPWTRVGDSVRTHHGPGIVRAARHSTSRATTTLTITPAERTTQ